MAAFHALIRTHHIVSRRKLSILRSAAKDLGCGVVLRTGGVPGLMYVASQDEKHVSAWVERARGLRYKDFQVLRAPMELPNYDYGKGTSGGPKNGAEQEWQWEEVAEVKDFGRRMGERVLWEWWREAMGYVKG
jgi:hypothetical protein